MSYQPKTGQIKLWTIQSSDFDTLRHYYFTQKEDDEAYIEELEDEQYLIELALEEGDADLAESISSHSRGIYAY